MSPSLCIISEGIGPYGAIPKVAFGQVEAAVAGGWRVTVVAKRLHESLRDRVEWRPLYVPPRGFALQWLAGRTLIRRAMGDVGQFDVVHGHQPQIADLCDTYQCHFLTRAAHERGCLADGAGLRGAIDAAQKRVVLHAEDYFYRRWNGLTRMLFDSELTRREFARLYGMPPRQDVLVYPCPAFDPPTEERRRLARERLVGKTDDGTIVAGFLGGLHERKGYRRLVTALAGEPDVFLLMGGLHSDGFDPPELRGHFRSLGLVDDLDCFYAACDVLLVPSHFEPLGLVAFEAASRGVPTVATPEVGALPHLIEHAAGLEWRPPAPLVPVVRRAVAERERLRSGCQALAADYSADRIGARLERYWREALERRRAHDGGGSR